MVKGGVMGAGYLDIRRIRGGQGRPKLSLNKSGSSMKPAVF